MDVGGGPLNLAGRQPQLVDLRYRAHHRAVGAGVGPEHLVVEVAASLCLGVLSLISPTTVLSLRSRQPFRRTPSEPLDRHLHGGVEALPGQPDGQPPEVGGALVGGRHVREGHRGRLVRHSVHAVISCRLSVGT